MDKVQLQQATGIRSFAEVAEWLPLAVLVIDADRLPRYANPLFRQFFAEQAELPLEQWFPAGQLASLNRFLQQNLVQRQTSEVRNPFRCRLPCNGRPRLFEMDACPVPGETVGTLALFFWEATTALRRKRSQLTRFRDMVSILENTGAVIYIKDRRGRYRYVNCLFEDLFHVKNNQIRGKTDFDLFNDRIAEQFRQVDEYVCETGEVMRIQEEVTHDDGPHTYISVKFPLFDHKGRIRGLAGISTDITEQLWAEQEMQAAQAVQKLLYPKTAPQIPGYDIAGMVSPADIASGDYYDYLWPKSDRLIIAVGDVSGHGLASALEMVETRSYLRAILRTEIQLDVTVECLNEFLFRDFRDNTFVTLFLLELDFQTGRFRYVGAGHQAFLLHADGTTESLNSTGMMLGIDSQVEYGCSDWRPLEPGALLILTTDGISEAISPAGELFGNERIVQLVRERADFPAQEIVDQLIQTSRHFPAREVQADDMTCVIVKRYS